MRPDTNAAANRELINKEESLRLSGDREESKMKSEEDRKKSKMSSQMK